MPVHVGAKIRLYDQCWFDNGKLCVEATNGWFYDGEIVSVVDGVAEVDFADWLAAWPVSAICECHLGFDEFLIPIQTGWMVDDFRSPAAQIPLPSIDAVRPATES